MFLGQFNFQLGPFKFFVPYQFGGFHPTEQGRTRALHNRLLEECDAPEHLTGVFSKSVLQECRTTVCKIRHRLDDLQTNPKHVYSMHLLLLASCY